MKILKFGNLNILGYYISDNVVIQVQNHLLTLIMNDDLTDAEDYGEEGFGYSRQMLSDSMEEARQNSILNQL
jgi:hypothetical protein